MESGSVNGGSECSAQQEKGPDTVTTGEPKKAPLSVSTIQVNPCQRGNPILKEIRNVPWEFVEGIVPDYILGSHCVALFLSLRYFNLHPDYIHDRDGAALSFNSVSSMHYNHSFVKDRTEAINQIC